MQPYRLAFDRPRTASPDAIVGYCYGIRSERKLCEAVSLNMVYRRFCRLDLDDAVPDHSSFSKDRRGHFRDGDLLRDVFERVVEISLTVGLIKGESFVVDDRRHVIYP